MTRKDRKRYSREFKVEAVRQCDESGKPVTQVARDLDISVHQLYRWREEVLQQADGAFSGSGRRGPNGELARLRRDNDGLRQELDLLKKALTFFARAAHADTSALPVTVERAA
jgi:transposase